jgi:hypothetical protein
MDEMLIYLARIVSGYSGSAGLDLDAWQPLPGDAQVPPGPVIEQG